MNVEIETGKPKLTVLQGGRSSSIVVREVVGLDIRHLLLGEPLMPVQPIEARPSKRLTIVADVHIENH